MMETATISCQRCQTMLYEELTGVADDLEMVSAFMFICESCCVLLTFGICQAKIWKTTTPTPSPKTNRFSPTHLAACVRTKRPTVTRNSRLALPWSHLKVLDKTIPVL